MISMLLSTDREKDDLKLKQKQKFWQEHLVWMASHS